MNSLNKIAASIKKYIWILYFLNRDPRLSRVARIVVMLTLAYALSPIDLIPDFIPILGVLDDLIIIPLGIYVIIKLVPPEVWNDCNLRAEASIQKGDALPKNWFVASIIILFWLLIIALISAWSYQRVF